jgi:hypothetical protein
MSASIPYSTGHRLTACSAVLALPGCCVLVAIRALCQTRSTAGVSPNWLHRQPAQQYVPATRVQTDMKTHIWEHTAHGAFHRILEAALGR